MNMLIKRHPVDDCYLEFFIIVGDDPWYMWTIHEDNIYNNDVFLEAIKSDLEEHGEARVKMVHFGRLDNGS